MKKIPLTQGKEALVDDEWFEYLNQWKWYAKKGGHTYYAVRQMSRARAHGKQTTIRMHRVIPGLENDNRQVDHIDGNGLNNQVDNLRVCNHSQNGSNSSKSYNNLSGYKGVGWQKFHGKWKTQICVNNQVVHIGYFTDKIEAAKAYDQAAIKYHGEFARLNFPEDNYAQT